jgi:hypothetical protein
MLNFVSLNYSFLRFEIEKKLRLAKKQEMRKKRDQEKKKEEKMDAKERSKERKKTVEENRGKVDKKAAAMNMLKARREEKRERGVYALELLIYTFLGLKKNEDNCKKFESHKLSTQP